jgi:hypothetical protein
MPLLNTAIAAHGGLDRWSEISGLDIRVRIGGNLLATRFVSPRTRAFDLFVDTQRVYATLSPFPGPGQRGILDGRHVRIETDAGVVISERDMRVGSDGRPERRSRWDDLDVLFFFAYALWNYSVTPYLFTWPGFECREGEAWRDQQGEWRQRLHVVYPPEIPTHSREQTFYFDETGLLKRLDYTADVFGPSARAAHLCHEHRGFDGLVFPTHRVVWWRFASGRPFRLMSAMEGWVDDVRVRLPVPSSSTS